MAAGPPGTDARFYPALYRVARAINSSLDEAEVLRLVARSVTEATGGKGCAIRLLSPDRARLDLLAAHGLSAEYLSKGALRPELAASASAALAGRPAMATLDEPAAWQYPEATRAEGIGAALTVPLLVAGAPLGILRLYTRERRPFAPAEVAFVSALADLSALAIRNAQLHQALQRNYDQLAEYAFGAAPAR
jgi:signal transduction protein with GAF and PtsI domain